MAETITESFCERCGTRYEFKAPTRLNPLRKTRGLIGGLKNYVLSQDALGDAIGDAMRSEEEQLASAQLEAFHESFNFCIDCRQYTCVNCWNDDSGRCRSCAPIPGTDDLAERIAASMAGQATVAAAEPIVPEPTYANATNAASATGLGIDAWPSSDLPPAPTGDAHRPTVWGNADGDGLADEWPAQPGAAAADVDESPGGIPTTANVESEPEVQPAADLVTATDADRYVPASTGAEPVVSEVAPEPEPESIVAEVAPEHEPVVAEVAAEPEPEPVLAEAELMLEPMVATVEPEPEPERPRLRVVAWDEDAEYDLEPEPISADVIEAVSVASDADAEPLAAEAEAEPVEMELEPEPIVAEVELEPVEVEPEPEPIVAEVEAEPVEMEPEPEPIVAEVELEPVEVEPEPEAIVAEVDAEPVEVELQLQPVAAETEAERVEMEPEPEPIAAEVEVEPVEVEPQPVVAEPEPEPQPAAGEVEPQSQRESRPPIAPISETILRFPQRPAAPPPVQPERVAAEAETPELAARRAQLDLLGLGDPGEGPVQHARPTVLPYRSRGAAVTHGELAAHGTTRGTGFWEASAREVAGASGNVGVQNCGQCGLSLSANARFCRRCGTRQAQSA